MSAVQSAGSEAVYAQLERMVADVHGWSPQEQLYSLFLIAYASRDLGGDLAEIGAWCGRSSVALGLAARLAGATRVYSVDLFPRHDDWHENEDGTYSLRVKLEGGTVSSYDGHRLWREPYLAQVKPLYERHPGILDHFRETLERAGLAGVVEPLRGTSDLLKAKPGLQLRMAFIDGDHSYEGVCRDIRNVRDLLLPGGWICFDDAFSSYEGVDRAIRELIVADPGIEAGVQLTRKLFVARKRRKRAG
jgi:predicted O-methyltransferase YrrM